MMLAMGNATPAVFPEQEFHAFLVAARAFFPPFLGHEMLDDEWERFWQFDRSYQAVRYRYRLCSESNDEFRSLLANADDEWREGISDDQELRYQIERAVYTFFMSALSVFESFGFCLYFVGNAVRPADFLLFAQPRRITLEATKNAFSTTFPQARISQVLPRIMDNPVFMMIDAVRNVLSHRVAGTRSVTGKSTHYDDGTISESREESWYMPGLSAPLVFSETMLQAVLDGMTSMLTELALAARQFAEEVSASVPKTRPATPP